MKATIDIPDSIFEQTKVAAARRRTTFKKLVIEGQETILRQDIKSAPPPDALARLRQGYHLSGTPLGREECQGR